MRSEPLELHHCVWTLFRLRFFRHIYLDTKIIYFVNIENEIDVKIQNEVLSLVKFRNFCFI